MINTIICLICTVIAIVCIVIMVYMYSKRVRELNIVDAYCDELWARLCDYDGYYDPKTKQGSIEGLASLIDEAMLTCDRIRDRDDKAVIYSANEKKFNILFEEVKK